MRDEIEKLIGSYSNMTGVLSSFIKPPREQEGKTSTFIVTDECNLRCTYCYLTDKQPNRLSWDDAKRFIDLVFEKNLHLKDVPLEGRVAQKHGKIWDFIGGEPFLESELIEKIMEYILKKNDELPQEHPWKHGLKCTSCEKDHMVSGFRFSFSSNGTLLNNPSTRNYMEKYRRMTSLSITIDGPKDMHDLCRVHEDGSGSFDETMSNWDWYKKTYPRDAMYTKSTISHENIQHINTIAKFFWEELDMEYIFMNCVFENVWHKGDQLILFDQICDLADYLLVGDRWKKKGIRWFNLELGKKDNSDTKWCGAGTHMDAIGPDGKIYPCLRFKSLDNQKPFVIGDLDSWKDESLIERLNVGNCNNTNIQKEVTGVDCAACTISALCPQCQAYTYDVYGRADVKAPFICPMHKATVFANMYLMGNITGWLTPEDRDALLVMLDEYTKDDYFGFNEDGSPNKMFIG